MAYTSLDYYCLDDLLTEEEQLARSTFRRFVEEEVLPSVPSHFRAGTFPNELPKRLGHLGGLGPSLSGYGCAGLSPMAYGLIMQELERADSGIRSFASVQSSLVMYPIHAFGSEEQKNRWLPAMAQGDAIGCFGLTEPDFGSNPSSMRTTATLTEGGSYVLNGEKRWITSGGLADVALVWARTKPEGEIRGFLVERGTKGFSTRDIHGKFSLRASVTSELIFEDCVVPAWCMLPGVRGLKGPLSCLSQARFGICFGVLGAAMACYDEALRYTKDRAQFARPLAGHQLVQEKLVQMVEIITNGQLLAYRMARLKEKGILRPAQISLAKRHNVRGALHVARLARDLLGANGITDEYQAGRHMCNLESVFTYEGTDHIHTLIVGQDITGESAFE